MNHDFPYVFYGKVSAIFSQISSSDSSRKEKKSSATRGTYLWMNPLKTHLVEQKIREMTEMENLTRMNSTTIIIDILQMLHLMEGVLNETNSSHTTRKH